METTAEKHATIIKNAVESSLKIIEQEREREIITRRFGLTGPKETLEQIGEMLNITRERVRQLEKAILIRLRIASEDGLIKDLPAAEKIIIRNLTETGRIARIAVLAEKIYGRPPKTKEKALLAFLGEISSSLTTINENDRYHASIGIAEYGDEKAIRNKVDQIVSILKSNKAPLSLDELDDKLNYEHPDHIAAIAAVSKQLANRGGLWGLAKWPAVNPKNIRDKIFVILEEKKEPMHFSDIATAIAESNFRRKNVTVQAIHNELIKDPRFVLIGRGIYALDTWGYTRGTVGEIITDILKKSKKPLTREEIVRQVLKSRKVKETTILLNLQNKKLFKKVDKNAFTLA